MNKIKNSYRAIVGLIIFAALALSLYDQLTATLIPTIWGRCLGYISYFTELSNISVMLWYFNKVFFKKKIKFLNKVFYSFREDMLNKCFLCFKPSFGRGFNKKIRPNHN